MVSKVHLLPDDGEEDYAQDNVLANLEGKKRKDRRQGESGSLVMGFDLELETFPLGEISMKSILMQLKDLLITSLAQKPELLQPSWNISTTLETVHSSESSGSFSSN